MKFEMLEPYHRCNAKLNSGKNATYHQLNDPAQELSKHNPTVSTNGATNRRFHLPDMPPKA